VFCSEPSRISFAGKVGVVAVVVRVIVMPKFSLLGFGRGVEIKVGVGNRELTSQVTLCFAALCECSLCAGKIETRVIAAQIWPCPAPHTTIVPLHTRVQVEVCCFDKTGTLTSDHLLLEEVVVPQGENCMVIIVKYKDVISLEVAVPRGGSCSGITCRGELRRGGCLHIHSSLPNFWDVWMSQYI